MDLTLRARPALVTLFVLLMGMPQVAHAQRRRRGQEPAPPAAVAVPTPAEEARALFLRGQSAYADGHYEESIELWTQAYATDPRPLLQYNLSLAHERLGQYRAALTALETYLSVAPADDENLSSARARSAAIRERIQRTAIRLVGGRDGGRIQLDGEPSGVLPRPDPILVQPGEHEIVIEFEGYEPFRTAVVVPETQVLDVNITATRAVAQAQSFPVAPVIVLSIGGASLIAGGVLGGLALSQAGSAPSSTSGQAQSARDMALVADIALGAGAAIAIGGTVWLIMSLSEGQQTTESPAAQPTAQPTGWLTPNGGGFGVVGQF